ncbi:hypothetical protein ACFPT7_06760 [Acidicapsa dinghuensis]|uniref:Peptidase MA-like domain-containing protein n=1 Tax=Acidicapsa dinghuensis TaxID=2218256 RepID=A0ABW1EFF0_9BACT|nr:hypothetical protein [Acidicapsa dinghuensis]
MFLFSSRVKLPVTDEDRLWVDEGFARLEGMVGRQRMLDAKVRLPVDADFPDRFDGSEAAAERMFERICGYMEVDGEKIDFELMRDDQRSLRELLPEWSARPESNTGGLYMPSAPDAETSERCVVAVNAGRLKDPVGLVAVIAHELCHVILLEGGLIDPDVVDHEPMTDLLTVFLGFGVFTANAAARFSQYQDGQKQGWSMQKLGYLPEQVFGYALAKFARERGERKPVWDRYLETAVRDYFTRSCVWLEKHES